MPTSGSVKSKLFPWLYQMICRRWSVQARSCSLDFRWFAQFRKRRDSLGIEAFAKDAVVNQIDALPSCHRLSFNYILEQLSIDLLRRGACMTNYRIGQIVPSSNVTMETEIPALLRAREGVSPERFTFHSSRMRMKKVTKEELAAMDAASDRCALELSDAKVDVMGYACLVAIMSMGRGYHRESQSRLHEVTKDNESPTPVVSSAGALVEGIMALGARRVAVVAPYMKPLTELVVDYIGSEGIEVVEWRALEISDNLMVAAHDPSKLPGL